MTRIFLSHSSKDNAEAVALKQWLVGQNPPLAKEIFLDLDGVAGIPPGTKWKDALRLASHRAEAIICLLSASWEDSIECIAEFRTAETLGKKIFPARLEPDTGRGPTRDWQFIDLFADSPEIRTTEIDIGTDQPVRFSNDGLLRLRDEIVGKRVGPDSFVWPPGGPGSDKYADRAPYRGWEPLDENDAGVFFGRDTELLRGLDQLRHIRGFGGTQLFVILAASGAGKSSFLRAGLLPRLRRDDRSFLPLDLVVRPERNVLTGENGFARSIWKTRREQFGLIEPDLGDIKRACCTDTERVCELLRELQHTARQRLGGDEVTPPTLVLPLDQSEELFTGEAGPEAGRFLNMIAELADSNINADSDSPAIQTVHDLSLIVAITIRTDRHHDLQDAPQLAGVPIVTFTDLRAMPPHQFREVILGPARRATAGGRALEVESALVDQLVADCTTGADTLPLLALTLSRLFHDYGGDGDLRLDEYGRMGRIHRVVENEINHLLSRDEAERRRQLELLRQAFIPFLVSVDADTDQAVRRVAKWEELPKQARPLLNELVSKRLLVRRDQDSADKHAAGGMVEVALESLFRQWDELKKWLDEEREDLKKAVALERDAKEWAQHGARENWLLEGDRVTDAEKLLARPDFAKRLRPAQDYIRKSRAKTERLKKEKRRQLALRRRSRVLKVTVVVLIFCIFAVAAFMTTLRYFEQKKDSAALTLMSTAEQMLNGGRAGGDVLALQLLLAAKQLEAPDDELLSLANSRRDLVKIIENPSNTPVQSVAVSPNGRLIASAGDGSPVRIWDAVTGKKAVDDLQVAGELAPRIAFPPPRPSADSADNGPDRTDNLLVTGASIHSATGNDQGIVQVWDAENRRPVGNPVTLPGKVVGIAFGPDAHKIATGMDDGTVYMWDRDNGGAPKPLYQPDFRRDEVRQYVSKWSLEFSPDGRFIVFAGADSDVRLLNVESGEMITDSAPSNRLPESVAFSPGGDRVAVGRVDGTIEFLNGHTLQSQGVLTERPDSQPVSDLAFSPEDGASLISASGNNTIQVWNTRSHSPIGQPLTGHHGGVTSLQVLRVPGAGESFRIVSGSTDGTIREWDASIRVPLATDQGHIRSIAYDPDGTLAVGCGNGTISLWYPERADAAPRLLRDPPQGADRVATSDAAGKSEYGCQANSPSDEARRGISSLAFNPRDKTQIVSGSADGSVKLWNVNGAEPETLNDNLPTRIMAVAFSGDGTQVVTGGYGTKPASGLVQLWDARSRQLVKRVETDYPVWTVAFSPDSRSGSKFVTGSGGRGCGCVQLWDAEKLEKDGEPMKRQPQQDVNVVRFSPDGKYIVSGWSDGKIVLWDVEGHLISDEMTGDKNPVTSLAFSNDNDGKWMVSSDSAGKVRIWDISNQRAIGAPFTGNPSWLTSVAFSPDDEQIVSASDDGDLHLWPAPKPLENAICDLLSSSMTAENWDLYVKAKYPPARYRDLCK